MKIPIVSESQPPRYARSGDAGADLSTAEALTLQPGERALVGTGVRIGLPEGTVGMITPRSGLALRTGLSIVNAPGIIDSGYRGEIKVCLINLDRDQPIHINVGDRIAQLVITPFISAQFEVVSQLDETARGAGGYGSSGITTNDREEDS